MALASIDLLRHPCGHACNIEHHPCTHCVLKGCKGTEHDVSVKLGMNERVK